MPPFEAKFEFVLILTNNIIGYRRRSNGGDVELWGIEIHTYYWLVVLERLLTLSEQWRNYCCRLSIESPRDFAVFHINGIKTAVQVLFSFYVVVRGKQKRIQLECLKNASVTVRGCLKQGAKVLVADGSQSS